MQYEDERDNGPNGEPSIQDMTIKAIDILKKNSKGYFLLVEGSLYKTLIMFILRWTYMDVEDNVC